MNFLYSSLPHLVHMDKNPSSFLLFEIEISVEVNLMFEVLDFCALLEEVFKIFLNLLRVTCFRSSMQLLKHPFHRVVEFLAPPSSESLCFLTLILMGL